MNTPEVKICPRCTNAFECKLGNILQCDCNKVSLNDEQREFIESKYDDCLCRQCLFLLRQEYEMECQQELALQAVANQTARFFLK